MDMSLSTSIDLQGIQSLFTDPLPSVQEIASFKVAISLWCNFLFGEKFDEDEDELGDSLNEKYRLEVEKSLQFLSSPNLIKDLVKECLIKVENEMDSWICYTKYETLPSDKIIVYRSHLKCCVWQSNGKIDYRKSAKKLLQLSDLTSVEKFGIMCKYCLEAEIKKVSVDSEVEAFFEGVDMASSPLTFYWICNLKDELHKMASDTNPGSVEGFMITQPEVDNWFAIEYFWDRLNEQEQITKAAELLIKWPTIKFQKLLLAKMNESQVRQLIANIPVDIIANFWTRLAEPEAAIALWARVKNSLNGEQFHTLLDKVFDDRIYQENYIPLMVKLWDSADDRHKSYFLQHKKEFIIKHYFMPTFCSTSHSLKFLLAMLSYSSTKYRKEIMMEHGHNLTVNNHFSEVDKIIKLCLPDEDQVVLFKKQIIKSTVVRDHCNRLFENGDFEYLNKFVEFYSPDHSTAVNFKKLILESNTVESVFIFKPCRWSELEKLIDQVYPDLTFATRVKKNLILSSGMKCFIDWSNIELLHQLIDVTTRFLTEEEMAELKDTLRAKFRDRLRDGSYWKSFEEAHWQVFASWFLGSEQKIREFKQSLPFEHIFNDIMELMLMQYIYEDEFKEKMLSVMDKFLKWYLVEPEEVKKYKLSRVFAFENVELIEASIARREEQYTRILLTWFLDNDEEQICKFRSQFSEDKISKMI